MIIDNLASVVLTRPAVNSRGYQRKIGQEMALRDFPLFFLYHNLITDTPEHELVTDLLLPLK